VTARSACLPALPWRPGWLQAFPVHLPTFVARLLAFKMAVDSSKLPAVGDLLRAMARLLLGGGQVGGGRGGFGAAVIIQGVRCVFMLWRP